MNGDLYIERLKDVCAKYDFPFEYSIREFEAEMSDNANRKN